MTRRRDEHFVYRGALARVTCNHIAMCEMAEIPSNDSAVVENDIALPREARDSVERTVDQSISICGLSTGRNANSIALEIDCLNLGVGHFDLRQ